MSTNEQYTGMMTVSEVSKFLAGEDPSQQAGRIGGEDQRAGDVKVEFQRFGVIGNGKASEF